MLFLVPPAAAHPEVTRVTVHQLRLEVGAEDLVVEYAVDVPYHTHGDGRDDLQTLEELLVGLLLRVNGEPVALELLGEPMVRRRPDRAGTRVRLTAPSPGPGTHRVAVSNGNYPDLPPWSSGAIYAGPGVEVLDTSLWTLEGGEILRDTTGGWSGRSEARQVEAEVRIRPLQGWFDALGGHDLRPARATRPQGWAQAWLGGGLRPGLLLLLAALAALLGAWMPRFRRDLTLGVAAVALAAPPLAFLLPGTGLALAEVGVGLAAVALALRGTEAPWPLALAALALAVATRAGPYALVVIAAFALGLATRYLASRAPSGARVQGAGRALALVLAGAVALRGLLHLAEWTP